MGRFKFSDNAQMGVGCLLKEVRFQVLFSAMPSAH
jgi:hypothetical protein